ncbi:hypothetical protein JST56_06020 [Candidatus Dependentiae bacterium]|nr:hypothetical protein [Candidatus Dependentiae bacterium]
MKKYLLIVLAITLSQQCIGMTEQHERFAYKQALFSYKEIIEKFGKQVVAHKKSPKTCKPMNRDRLIIELYKVLQTYCQRVHPSLHVDDECAFKLAESIEADDQLIPESKRFILGFFTELDFYQSPSEFSESVEKTTQE